MDVFAQLTQKPQDFDEVLFDVACQSQPSQRKSSYMQLSHALTATSSGPLFYTMDHPGPVGKFLNLVAQDKDTDSRRSGYNFVSDVMMDQAVIPHMGPRGVDLGLRHYTKTIARDLRPFNRTMGYENVGRMCANAELMGVLQQQPGAFTLDKLFDVVEQDTHEAARVNGLTTLALTMMDDGFIARQETDDLLTYTDRLHTACFDDTKLNAPNRDGLQSLFCELVHTPQLLETLYAANKVTLLNETVVSYKGVPVPKPGR